MTHAVGARQWARSLRTRSLKARARWAGLAAVLFAGCSQVDGSIAVLPEPAGGDPAGLPQSMNPGAPGRSGTTTRPVTDAPITHSVAGGTLAPFEVAAAPRGWGRVQLVRGPAGTEVTVYVEGLARAATYRAHVHALPCAIAEGGGHYLFDPAITEPIESNELWLTIETDDRGVGTARTESEHVARGDALSIVVHDTPNADTGAGPKLLCGDIRLPGDTWSAAGRFGPTATSEAVDMSIDGSARLEVTATGTSFELRLDGLDPAAQYAAHVHAFPCDTAGAGPHYEIDPSVEGVVAENELWPVVMTDAGGRSETVATFDHVARADAQSVVVHRVRGPDDKPKVACATLRRSLPDYQPLVLEGAASADLDAGPVAATARLVRMLDGSTEVAVEVSGFPEGEFGSHLHASRCATDQGSGHYQVAVGGPADPTNELWPTVTVGPDGSGSGAATFRAHHARAEALAVVVHAGDRRVCIPVE